MYNIQYMDKTNFVNDLNIWNYWNAFKLSLFIDSNHLYVLHFVNS